MELFGLQVARAGQFLREYETKRYSFLEKFGISFNSITLPAITEDYADLSFWQAGVNWSEYAKHARAAIIRLGQGAWVDTEFEYNYKNAKENKLILGGYWFYDDRQSPAEQAQTIIKLMKDKVFEMELFIDWEHDYGGKYPGLKNVVALMKILEAARLDVKDIGIYTGYYWFKEHTTTSDATSFFSYLKLKPLWLAWYAAPNIVKLPAPWTNWTHWQKGTPTVAWGQPTAEIDMNSFNGTKSDFTNRYFTSEPAPQGTHLVELYVDKVLVYSQTI